jgi:FkbM family methyltransferase
MRLVMFWLNRRQRYAFLKKLKEKQKKSLNILGISPFFVSVFDTDARSIIEEGVPSFESISRILDEVNARQCETIATEIAIDVGANYGAYSVLFSHYFSEVISYEAHPVTFNALEMNVKSTLNIRISPFAISSTIGSGYIHEYRSNHSGSASLEEHQADNRDPIRSHHIEKSTLDIELGAIKSRIGLIKIDVEGHELEVLKGSHNILLTHKPSLVFEQNTGDKDVLSFLENYGYRTFYVPNTDLIKSFGNRNQLIKYLKEQQNPISSLWKLYSDKFLVEFKTDSLPKSELVLSFHNEKSQHEFR